ncbi:alpha/beta-hydrolase [Mollisia scopiformis]|uniref:Alpha/beta-hydrolase n=1 Tax=Mollisia scopiformis TaxID=149040 RepID=A0A132B3Z9_MOLSC|nr:alpha/beta-hydrolase [Mollisia scopiformis]KUJ06397.1 alpha/beta-hydrolase [Mollisia scopiformis]
MSQCKEASHHRSYFYVGGEYVKAGGGHVMENQMYVERLLPADVTKPYPIVFIHGGAQTGTNWLNKPDGGRGWASWFLEQGYEVYIVDQVHTGRSAWSPQSSFPQIMAPVEYIQEHFTATKNYPLWPQAHGHTQWPGTGMMGDPIFDAFYASQAQFLADPVEQERTMRLTGISLLDKIGECVLITHSRGGLHGWAWADARPALVKVLIQVEPRGPPFHEAIFSTRFVRPWGLTSIPLTYDPSPKDEKAPLRTKLLPASSEQEVDCYLQDEPARQLVNLKEMPILVVTGAASYHATYDHSIIAFLRQAYCEKVDHMKLGDIGIHGNGHMLFLEKNSDDIAEALEKWIDKTLSY